MLTREEAVNTLAKNQCKHISNKTDTRTELYIICHDCACDIISLLKQQPEQPKRKVVQTSCCFVPATVDRNGRPERNIILTVATFDNGEILQSKNNGNWQTAWETFPPIPQDEVNDG